MPFGRYVGGDEREVSKIDNIKTAFFRLQKKLDISKSLSSFKKTSASLLRGNESYQRLEDLFLGHAPQRMSDKHYTQVPQELFDRAIYWLGEYYDVIEKTTAEAAPQSAESV